jgi:glycosyltransferase involved in cell wall biosynthesis
MFMLQCAVVREGGGITTAVEHYERMCRALAIPSAIVFGGPALKRLRAQGAHVVEAPAMLTSPLSAALPFLGGLGAELRALAGGQALLVVVHSDRTLPGLRRLLPHAYFVTPCHSDKFKHKHQADLVIALNATQHEAARKALPGVRAALLGNPYVAPPPPPLKPGEHARINFVGRFTDTKQPQLLVEAMARLGVRPPLRLIGAGELHDRIAQSAQAHGLNADFPGWLEAPFTHFHDRDILVLPSLWEGLPYLLLEALDHGVPVIASDNSGNRAALGDGAYGALFPSCDAGELARQIQVALDDVDALRAKAKSGGAALRERYGAAQFWRGLQAELKVQDHV